MATTATIFLAVAISCALIGIFAPWDQGLPEIMFWFSGMSLVTAIFCMVAHIGLRQSQR